MLRIGNASQIGKELLRGIDTNHVESQAAVVVHHLLELVLAQHAMIDKDTSEAVADSTVQQHGSHTGIDTARKSKDNAVVTQLLFQLCHRGVDKRGGTPLLTGATDIDYEVLEQRLALKRVEHLWMELHCPNGFTI